MNKEKDFSLSIQRRRNSSEIENQKTIDWFEMRLI